MPAADGVARRLALLTGRIIYGKTTYHRRSPQVLCAQRRASPRASQPRSLGLTSLPLCLSSQPHFSLAFLPPLSPASLPPLSLASLPLPCSPSASSEGLSRIRTRAFKLPQGYDFKE